MEKINRAYQLVSCRLEEHWKTQSSWRQRRRVNLVHQINVSVGFQHGNQSPYHLYQSIRLSPIRSTQKLEYRKASYRLSIEPIRVFDRHGKENSEWFANSLPAPLLRGLHNRKPGSPNDCTRWLDSQPCILSLLGKNFYPRWTAGISISRIWRIAKRVSLTWAVSVYVIASRGIRIATTIRFIDPSHWGAQNKDVFYFIPSRARHCVDDEGIFAIARLTWLKHVREYNMYRGIHDDKKSCSHVGRELGSKEMIVSFRPIPFYNNTSDMPLRWVWCFKLHVCQHLSPVRTTDVAFLRSLGPSIPNSAQSLSNY